MNSPELRIGERKVGPGHPTFLIAEMSANHCQDLDRARRIVDAAKAAGADAIKLQTYTADTMTLPSDAPAFRIGPGTRWEGMNLYDLYQSAHTPWEWHAELKQQADALGLVFFSTPFDDTSVDFLEELQVEVYKVASFELTHLPLLRRIARTGKPIIMSTGMSTREEIREAIDTIEANGGTQLALLKCTSAYPAAYSAMNLRAIPALREAFSVVTGLSDHTLGTEVPVASIALGASIVEKHFILTRSDPSPDAAFSIEPEEFASMARAIRHVEEALGEPSLGTTEQERPSLSFRRSLFVTESIKKGHPLTTNNVRVVRPALGLAPKHYDCVLGAVAARDIPSGTPLHWDDIVDVNGSPLVPRP